MDYAFAGTTPVQAKDRVQIKDPVTERWLDGVVLECHAAQFSVGLPVPGKGKPLTRRLFFLYSDRRVTWIGASDVRVRSIQ